MSEVVAYRDKAMVGSGSSDVMLDMRIPQKWSVHGTETALSHHLPLTEILTVLSQVSRRYCGAPRCTCRLSVPSER